MGYEKAAVNGVECDLFDSRGLPVATAFSMASGAVPQFEMSELGRLLVSPPPTAKQAAVDQVSDLKPGETLLSFLTRHVDGIESDAWVVSIGGKVVPRSMWGKTKPKDGQLIACSARPRKAVLLIVAMAVLTFFTMGAGAVLWMGALAGTAAGSVLGMAVFVVGSILINKVLGPKPPKPLAAGDQTYALSSQRNTARPDAPIGTLFGQLRIAPDLASKPYGWFEGESQYLGMHLLGGINVNTMTEVTIGDTAIGEYSGVRLYFNGFPGMANEVPPLMSNVDAVSGASLERGGAWVVRTTVPNTTCIQLDFEGTLYHSTSKGKMRTNGITFYAEIRTVGGAGD